MILAGMIRIDEESLICDLAETYHILGFRQLPARLVAILARGLGPDSRIMRKINGQNLTIEQFILADMRDKIAWLQWAKTKDGEKNRNHPKSILEALNGPEKKDALEGYNTVEEFEQARKRLMEI